MSVQAVVIGANGFLGRRLVETLCRRRNLRVSANEKLPVSSIVLFDVADSSDAFMRRQCDEDSRCCLVLGSLTKAEDTAEALRPRATDCRTVVSFHLAAMLSGQAEANFDGGMQVNLFGAITVIEQVRALGVKLGRPQIYVYVSTDYVACFNDTNRRVPINEEAFRLSPTSYGVHKACVELLVCDYSRHGFIDGRVARISAVIGRPGFSNSVSSSYSMIFTQTLLGRDYTVYPDMDYPYPCSCIDNNCRCLIKLAGKVTAEQLGHNRVVQLPARSLTLRQIWAATQRVAAELDIKLGAITQSSLAESPFSFKSMNVVPAVDHSRAVSLGLPDNVDVDSIIKEYVRRFVALV
ncbi:hypothetical protein BOX15_Mlig002898g1 [Macrostomum lignano]|uniref:Epimerase domain-containing protein n=2 Tax=Macrostomum lignano TaxID=282301 RepID=A0A1I8J191_9PLAT|nr:hypothetical protein BOX15_Mlig002898g1 [Macrostomum lignano]